MSKDKAQFPGTVAEIIANANKYGLPTFEQFAKNPEKWNPKPDILESVDRGSTLINKYVRTQVYEVDGYRTKSLEEAQSILFDQGYDLTEVDIAPELLLEAGMKCVVLVKFIKKKAKQRIV